MNGPIIHVTSLLSAIHQIWGNFEIFFDGALLKRERTIPYEQQLRYSKMRYSSSFFRISGFWKKKFLVSIFLD